MAWIFLIMLLPFGRVSACPAEVLETFGTLDVGTAAFDVDYWDAAFGIGAGFCTMLYEQFV